MLTTCIHNANGDGETLKIAFAFNQNTYMYTFTRPIVVLTNKHREHDIIGNSDFTMNDFISRRSKARFPSNNEKARGMSINKSW